MESLPFTFFNVDFVARPTGALWWPEQSCLIVGDLHLVKAERHARRGGAALPPYETRDTLMRLASDLDDCGAHQVICLGDSFDDAHACTALTTADRALLTRLQHRRDWIWITGNHDPDLPGLAGRQIADLRLGPVTFRHIAQPGARGEISAHYHPKAAIATRARRITRPAFLVDQDRLILPAYGTYTGGLFSHDPALADLMSSQAQAILTGQPMLRFPMPR